MFFGDQPDLMLFDVIHPVHLIFGIIVFYSLFYVVRKIHLRIKRLKVEREIFESELAEIRASHRVNGAPFHSDTNGYLSGFHPGTPCIRTSPRSSSAAKDDV
ncbi:DUF2681 domain-containing protein [Vibrio mytili]